MADRMLAQDVSTLAADRGATHYVMSDVNTIRKVIPLLGVSTTTYTTDYGFSTSYSVPLGSAEVRGKVYQYVAILVTDPEKLPMELRPQTAL